MRNWKTLSLRLKIATFIPFIIVMELIIFLPYQISRELNDIIIASVFLLVGLLFLISYYHENTYWLFRFVVKIGIFWGNISLVFAKYKAKNALYLGYGFGIAGGLSLLVLSIIFVIALR